MVKELLYSANRRLICKAAQRYILILSYPVLARLDRGMAIKMGIDVINGNQQDIRDTKK
jgi:hypothetical protein